MIEFTMNELDRMSADQIRGYLEQRQCTLTEAQGIYDHEMNGEMRAEVLNVIRNFMAKDAKPDVAMQPKKKGRG